ncbi:MAG: bifunctional nicotinamidase/pyrazinamidase [Fusobacteriaceae bacterium]|nr:bifunctional nicotinamidase/pyrazinamidase [Fusobacteriaceae bacterium]
MKNSALLIIDVQNDFCKKGTLEVKEANSIIPPINQLINFFNKKNLFIIATKDWHPKNHKSFAVNSEKNIGDFAELNGLPQVFWPVHCIQNSFGSEFHKDLLPIKNIVYKGENPEVDSYSGFFDNGKKFKTNLDDILKKNEIDTLYIGGLATDYCVKYTVLDALSLSYKVFLLTDCIKGVNINTDDSDKSIEEMKQKGAYLINSKEILNI